MRHWLRPVALLMVCGVLILSVPVEAAQKGTAVDRSVQRVESTQRGLEEKGSFLVTVWTVVKVQFASWFGISEPGTSETSAAPPDSSDPVKSSTDPNKTPPWLEAILYDNGGTGAEK